MPQLFENNDFEHLHFYVVHPPFVFCIGLSLVDIIFIKQCKWVCGFFCEYACATCIFLLVYLLCCIVAFLLSCNFAVCQREYEEKIWRILQVHLTRPLFKALLSTGVKAK